jgi:5'-nucleotidase
MSEHKERPLILVVNDDGVFAKGIRALAEVMIEFGDVVLVAPDKPQSGMGHAVTLHDPIRLKKVLFEVPVSAAYACTGTPVDAVKIAISRVLHCKPDLLVSGINHGANNSINVIYSGTMSAAIEGAVEDIPSIGFSLLDHSADADFDASKEVVRKVVAQALEHGIPKGVCLNVNIPKGLPKDIHGIRVCTQARARWEEEFEERTDPNGKKYYWMVGEFRNMDEREDCDQVVLESNFVSVVPVHFDLTAYHALNHIKQWSL